MFHLRFALGGNRRFGAFFIGATAGRLPNAGSARGEPTPVERNRALEVHDRGSF